MTSIDVAFVGSVPENYEHYLVPLLFRPYAEELARRAAAFQPRRVLETAAGTGVVTEALSRALTEAEILATDLNEPMLDLARRRIRAGHVRFREADAQELPFEDSSFDLVVSQFGIMFFPDKVRANAEARRVMRDGGHYLIAIWDKIDRNQLCYIAQNVLVELFPDNPPRFMERGPFGYHDRDQIERDVRAAGFSEIRVETIELKSRSPSARDAAAGLCLGSPMRVELEDYGPDALQRVLAAVEREFRSLERPNGADAPMSAHIVTATK